MYRVSSSLTAAALAATAVLAAAPAATAGPPQRDPILDEFSVDIEDFCEVPGLDVRQDGVVTGTSTRMIRGGPNGLLYFADHIRFTSTFTNLESGAFVTTRESTVTKDLHITDNGDGTLTIVVLATGNFTIFGENGKAIARNPGQVRFRIVIDHNGTPNDPDDDVELSFEVIKESTGRSDDFCAAVVAALG